VKSGGALREIAATAGAVELTRLHRFTDPAEAEATLAIRVGDNTGLDFYQRADRMRGGSRTAMAEAAYEGWKADMLAGKVTLISAATGAEVTTLSARAREERVAAGRSSRTAFCCATATAPDAATGSSPARTTAASARPAAGTSSRTATAGAS
jgi:hypothetical protein